MMDAEACALRAFHKDSLAGTKGIVEQRSCLADERLQQRNVSSELNFPPPRPVENASHFLQEDAGAEIGATIANWLES